MDIMVSWRDRLRIPLQLSRSSISKSWYKWVLCDSNYFDNPIVFLFFWPFKFKTKSISGTNHIQIWRGKTWSLLGHPVYKADNRGLAILVLSLSMYKCNAQTWSISFTCPWVPILIIFQQSPTGISWILSEICSLRGAGSIMLVENKSQPIDVSRSNCKDASHRPNFFPLHQGLSFLINVTKGMLLSPRNRAVYILPPFARGFAPGK